MLSAGMSYVGSDAADGASADAGVALPVDGPRSVGTAKRPIREKVFHAAKWRMTGPERDVRRLTLATAEHATHH